MTRQDKKPVIMLLQMKIEKEVLTTHKDATVVTIVWEKGDKLRGKPVDDLLRISVTLELSLPSKVVSYKAHSYEVVASSMGYIPKQVDTFTPYQLFQEGWKEIMKNPDFEYWKPKLQDELEDYIKEATKKKKTFSMKGDLNKAIFVATYLYYLNTVPLAIENRHEQICKKLNMSSGSFSKSLSRLSVPYEDCVKYSKKNKVNIFQNIDKMTINDKDVFLMAHTEKKLKGGYITPYAVEQIELYMQNLWAERGIDHSPSLDPYLQQAFVETK